MKRILFNIILLSFTVALFGQKKVLPFNGKIIVFQNKYVTTQKYNDHALSFFSRMDIQPSGIQKDRINTIYDTLDYYNIIDSLNHLAIYALHDQQSSLLDWVRDTSLISNSNVFYHQYKGISSDGTGYIDTRYNPNNSLVGGLNNEFIASYCFDNIIESRAMMGSYIGGNFHYLLARDNGSIGGAINSTSRSLNAISNGSGFSGIQRHRSDSVYIYKNGSIYSKRKINSASIPNGNLYTLRYNLNNTSQGAAVNSIIGATVAGSNLTNLQHQKLYEILDWYFTQTGAKGSEFTFDTANITYKRVMKLPYQPNMTLLQNRDNFKVAYTDDSLYFSVDTGRTYPHRILYANADSINTCYVFNNGIIKLFKDGNTVWESADSLQTIVKDTIWNTNGTPYVFHTPVNSLYPGTYFNIFNYQQSKIINGHDIFMFGNYGNTDEGANPVNLYSCVDGDSIFVVRTWGLGNYRDNGTAIPSQVAGNFLGDPADTLKARHVHGVSWINDTAIIYTGDASADEVRWLKATINPDYKTYTFTYLASGADYCYFKSTGLYYYNDTIYLGSDCTDDSDHKGVYKFSYEDINNEINHERIFSNTIHNGYGLNGNGNNIYYYTYPDREIIVSNDIGYTWKKIELKALPVSTNLYKMNMLDFDGYFGYYVGASTFRSVLIK